MPVVVRAGEAFGRATRVVDEVAQADDARVGPGAVVEQLRRCRRVEADGERHVRVVRADARHVDGRLAVAGGDRVGDGRVLRDDGAGLDLLGLELHAGRFGQRDLRGRATVEVPLAVEDLAFGGRRARLLARRVPGERAGVVRLVRRGRSRGRRLLRGRRRGRAGLRGATACAERSGGGCGHRPQRWRSDESDGVDERYGHGDPPDAPVVSGIHPTTAALPRCHRPPPAAPGGLFGRNLGESAPSGGQRTPARRPAPSHSNHRPPRFGISSVTGTPACGSRAAAARRDGSPRGRGRAGSSRRCA